MSVTLRNGLESVALLATIACTSCSDVSHNKAYQDYATNIISAYHDYRSTNSAVAEEGLLRFRRWLLTDKNAGEPWFSKDLNLLGVDGQLFSLYEFKGKTNQAEFFFHDAADVYERFLQSKGRPSHILTREELRERTARQETGVDVGWKRQKKGSDAVSQ